MTDQTDARDLSELLLALRYFFAPDHATCPGLRCPHCGTTFEGQRAMSGPDHAPKAGDLSFCETCTRLSLVVDAYTLRIPTAEEAARLETDAEVQRLRQFLLDLKSR